jgi:hypothetical protein
MIVISTSVFFWLVVWALIAMVRSVAHATRNKSYNIEDTKLAKAIKAKWDEIL